MTNSPPTVLLHGCYDNRNFGDVLMADMLSNYLRTRHGVNVLSPGMLPDVAEQTQCKTSGLFADPRNCYLGCYGGGGYLHGSSIRHAKRLLRYVIPAFAMRSKGIPYSIVGVGVGPKVSRVSAKLIRFLCSGAKVVAVREPQSRDILVEIGVDKQKIEVTADLVMSLQDADIPSGAKIAAKKLLEETQIFGRPQKLGLHLSLPETETALLHQILASVKAGLAHQDDVAIYWLQDHGNRTDAYQKLADQYFTSSVVLPPLDHWQLAAVLGELDAVLTTKLHVSIAAWALGKPVCGFSNHQKTARFFNQIDRSSYQVMRNGDSSVISDWVSQFEKQDERFFSDNKRQRDMLVRASRRNFDILDDLFDCGCTQ